MDASDSGLQPIARYGQNDREIILHRKAALFYKTLNGARVGDVFMSLIYIAELNDVPPFEYLIALLRHHDQVRVNPSDWMPWNYQQTLALRMMGSDPASQL